MAPPLEAPATFGSLLFEARVAALLTQREVARRSGVAPTTISEFENGRRPPPGPRNIERLCAAVNASDELREALGHYAEIERATARSVRISRTTPLPVASLLREIAHLGPSLTSRHIAAIRLRIREVTAM